MLRNHVVILLYWFLSLIIFPVLPLHNILFLLFPSSSFSSPSSLFPSLLFFLLLLMLLLLPFVFLLFYMRTPVVLNSPFHQCVWTSDSPISISSLLALDYVCYHTLVYIVDQTWGFFYCVSFWCLRLRKGGRLIVMLSVGITRLKLMVTFSKDTCEIWAPHSGIFLDVCSTVFPSLFLALSLGATKPVTWFSLLEFQYLPGVLFRTFSHTSCPSIL